MKIFVDADACPVQREVVQVAGEMELEVVFVKSFSHFSHDDWTAYVDTLYVDPGVDSADYKILALVKEGDLVITQDYGLASLCLPKKCIVLHHKGFRFTEHNIGRLLESRHISAMARQAGQRTKGPRAFTDEDRRKFARKLKQTIEQIK